MPNFRVEETLVLFMFFFLTQKLYINALEIYINNAPVSNES